MEREKEAGKAPLGYLPAHPVWVLGGYSVVVGRGCRNVEARGAFFDEMAPDVEKCG